MAFKATIKLGLVGGAAFATCKADIWGDNKTTIEYFNKKCDSCDKIKYYRKMMPNCEDMRVRWADSWNNGVKFLFHGVDDLPVHIANGGSWVYNQMSELSKSMEQPAGTEVAKEVKAPAKK